MTKTFSSTRSVPGVSETGPPLARRRSVRVAFVLAWLVFWLNTALFPCCEVLAAVFGDRSDDVSQSASDAQSSDHSDETHSQHSHHSPDSPCNDTFNAGPAINGVCAGLPTDRVLEWFAIDVPVAAGLTAVSFSANLAPRDYHPPPPPLRLYLQTQRLLI